MRRSWFEPTSVGLHFDPGPFDGRSSNWATAPRLADCSFFFCGRWSTFSRNSASRCPGHLRRSPSRVSATSGSTKRCSRPSGSRSSRSPPRFRQVGPNTVFFPNTTFLLLITQTALFLISYLCTSTDEAARFIRATLSCGVGVFWTHVSRVAPGLDLWTTLYRLSYTAVALYN